MGIINVTYNEPKFANKTSEKKSFENIFNDLKQYLQLIKIK